MRAHFSLAAAHTVSVKHGASQVKCMSTHAKLVKAHFIQNNLLRLGTINIYEIILHEIVLKRKSAVLY